MTLDPPWLGPTWKACEEPERPPDGYILWHYGGCRACMIKAEALLHQYPDDRHVQWLVKLMSEGNGGGFISTVVDRWSGPLVRFERRDLG